MSFELIDQEAEPARASAFLTENEGSIPFGTVVLQTDGRTERVSSIAVDEQGITNAFIRLLKEEKKNIYFLVGHQEKELTDLETSGLSSMRSKLEASNYEIRSLQLLENVEAGKVGIPEDASALVIAGPRSDFLEAEIDALRRYVEIGGNLIVLVDPTLQHGDSQPNALVDWLGELGIVLGDGVIIDASGVGQLFGFGPDVPLVTQYAPFHPVTEDFSNIASVFPLVRSVSHDGDTTEGLTHTAILTTSESSWGETRTEDITDLAPASETYGYISVGGDEKSETHGHGYATLALAEAYGMSPKRSARLERALVAAVRLIERIQGTEGGWYYQPRVMALHEGSITVCLVQALRAARNSGIQVDGGVIRRAEDYLLRLQNPDGLFRYDLSETSKSSVALTAAGIATLNMAGHYDTGVIQNGVDAIWAGLTPDAQGKIENSAFPFYRRLYIAQAFWQLSDETHFERWFETEREKIVRRQRRDGSWNDPRWGECYATAVNCLVLAIPEGLLPIFQR